jgi:hypothetical protein
MLCLLFHKWTRWRTIRAGELKKDGKVAGFYVQQQRQCGRCRKIELRLEDALP